MGWNQGNGNGQGQGNGYQPQGGYGQQEDVYDQMNRARDPGGARFPYIEAGRHKLALVTLENFMHRQDGKSTRALFTVLESSTNPQTGKPVHPVGSFVVKIYKLMERPKFEGQASNSEMLAHLCIALKNAPKGYPIGADIRTLLEDRPGEQLARGTVVECTGVANQKGTWVNLYWTAVEQTQEQIVAMRQRIEAAGVPQTDGNSAQRQAPQQGYQPQQTQQQYAPPQQGAYQNAGGPPPQGYGPPPQTQPAQAPQGAPQGGFLAQLPPQGPQGPQGGGNGGGRW